MSTDMDEGAQGQQEEHCQQHTQPVASSVTSSQRDSGSENSNTNHDTGCVQREDRGSALRGKFSMTALVQAAACESELTSSPSSEDSIAVIPPSTAEHDFPGTGTQAVMSDWQARQSAPGSYNQVPPHVYGADQRHNVFYSGYSPYGPGQFEMGSLYPPRGTFLQYMDTGSPDLCYRIFNPNNGSVHEPAYGRAGHSSELTPIPRESRGHPNSRTHGPTQQTSASNANGLMSNHSNFSNGTHDARGAWAAGVHTANDGSVADGRNPDTQVDVASSAEKRKKSRKRGDTEMVGAAATTDGRWDLKTEVTVQLVEMGNSTTQMRRWACFPLLLQPTKKPVTIPVEDRPSAVRLFCESFGEQYTEKRSFDKGVDTGVKKASSARGVARDKDAEPASRDAPGKFTKPRRKAVMYIGGGKNTPSAAKVEECRISPGVYRYQYFSRKDPEREGLSPKAHELSDHAFDQQHAPSPYQVRSDASVLFPNGPMHMYGAAPADAPPMGYAPPSTFPQYPRGS
eukprot:m.1426417 g.1426417  ORF g.1426417 m.1426417 type:complete len:512 (+) comp25065_c0_seq27:214-1749(+)